MDEEDSVLKPKQVEHGLKCTACGCRDLRVESTRPEGTRIRRARICRHCGKRTYTYEASVEIK